ITKTNILMVDLDEALYAAKRKFYS
ncbi:unnamed protein product, partial [Adineta steineri]